MESFEIKGTYIDVEGKPTKVTANINPAYSYAANVGAVWTSLNPEIAIVESISPLTAEVTGIRAGDVELTAAVNDNGQMVSRTKKFGYIQFTNQ